VEADALDEMIDYLEGFTYNRPEFIELDLEDRQFIVGLLKSYQEGKIN
jgi:hypothetical protein